MSFSRRKFVQAGAALAACTSIPKYLRASSEVRPGIPTEVQDPTLRALAEASLDVARSNGATYADARLDHTYQCSDQIAGTEKESMSFGVRVLVDGYWGFASSPVWSKDEASRLARVAVRNARANNLGSARHTELAPLNGSSQPLTGHWSTPIEDDPFMMSQEEIEDYFKALKLYAENIKEVRQFSAKAEFNKQEKLFVSTVGHYVTQVLYNSAAEIAVGIVHNRARAGGELETTSIAGAGFEYIRKQPIREQIKELVEELKVDLMLPAKPVDVGRYNTVIDAHTVASLMTETIGLATELDRALGYEANAGGTSYIVSPVEMIGTLKIGSPVISITANRSEPMGAATVKWDDEGVTPSEFTLVKDGILNDMQTDRESASILTDIYSRQQKQVHSYGCAYAPTSEFSPLTHTANLRMQPGAGSESFESLIEKVEEGVVFRGGAVDVDFQQVSGLIVGRPYEIKNGKIVSRLIGASVLFRTPELWNSVMEVGGENSLSRFGAETRKGQPARNAAHSVTGAPVLLKEATIIDLFRKA